MKNQTIANVWNGVYTYDPNPVLSDSYVDTLFELTWKIGWLGRFKGSIVDKHPGIPEPAVISGRLSHDVVRFTKRYHSLWLPDAKGNLRQLPDERSHVLSYDGRLEQGGTRITGTWQIQAERRSIYGLEWDFPALTGRWVATPAS